MSKPDDICACGHRRDAHIYYEGACRPGFVCEEGCTEFEPLVVRKGNVTVSSGRQAPVRRSRRRWVRPIRWERRWDEFQGQHTLRIHLRWPSYKPPLTD